MGVQRSAPFLLLALVVGSCGVGSSNPASEPAAPETAERPDSRPPQIPTVEVVVDEDGLWAAAGDGKRQLLADDGKYYEAHVSADGRFLAAEIALFSNLQVTRLFRRAEGSEPWQPAGDVTEEAWQAAARARGFAVEDVVNPRTRFLAWSEGGAALELEVSGRLPDGSDLRYPHRVRLDPPR